MRPRNCAVSRPSNLKCWHNSRKRRSPLKSCTPRTRPRPSSGSNFRKLPTPHRNFARRKTRSPISSTNWLRPPKPRESPKSHNPSSWYGLPSGRSQTHSGSRLTTSRSTSVRWLALRSNCLDDGRPRELGQERGGASSLLRHALNAFTQFGDKLRQLLTRFLCFDRETGEVINVPESKDRIQHVAQELLQSIDAFARNSHCVAREIRNARTGHRELAGLLGGGDHHGRRINREGCQGEVAIEEVVLGLVTGNQGQHVATHLVVLGELRTGVAVRNLCRTLLKRNVGNQFGHGVGLGYLTLLHLDAPSIFEQRGVNATTDVHPVAHHHRVTVLFHCPLVVPLDNWVTDRGLAQQRMRVVREIVFGQQVDVNRTSNAVGEGILLRLPRPLGEVLSFAPIDLLVRIPEARCL